MDSEITALSPTEIAIRHRDTDLGQRGEYGGDVRWTCMPISSARHHLDPIQRHRACWPPRLHYSGQLAFALARNNHNIWASNRISAGWIYAEVSNAKSIGCFI